MNEAQLKDIIGKLSANEKIIGLVKLMKPLDVFAVISGDLDLQKDDAKNIVAHLLVNAMEGMALPGIETNKKYPVPPNIRRDNDNEEIDEDSDNWINNLGQQTPDIKKYQFPTPRPEDDVWPYDGMTKAAMDVHNKSRKRGMMRERQKFKGPLEPDLRFNQPGGDGAGGMGIYSKSSPHNRDNSMPLSGRSFDAKGVPGWSSSPPGKKFQSNIELNVDTTGNVKPGEKPFDPDEESPVGSAIPQFTYGHSEPRNNGQRTGFRRK